MLDSNLQQTINLQQIASDPKNSVWVFASAGSGKTKILTDRVLRLLLSGVEPGKILCLTFTKNAATEMQDRINHKLSEWVLCDEKELEIKLHDLTGFKATAKELQKARTLFNQILDSEFKIKAQTIHSFCQSLIKIFPFEAKINPNFEIIDKTRENLLLKQAQKKLQQDALENLELRNLITKINSRIDEENFLKLLESLLSKKDRLEFLISNFFGIENVITEIYKKFSIDQNLNPQKIIAEFITKSNVAEIKQLALELENSGLKGNLFLSNSIKNFYFSQDSYDLASFFDYYSAFFTNENQPRKLSKKTLENPIIQNLATQEQERLVKYFEQLNSLQICEDSALLLRFTNKILEYYLTLKKRNAVLDYHDLIILSNELLANPDFCEWIKLKMDGSFDHILIDESQDTNHQQWNIIKALTDDFFSGLSANNQNRSIFIVGDEKQSIYAFQGSEANISEEIFYYFYEKSNQTLKKISLNNSFRSVGTILEAVDKIFSQSEIKKSISKISEFQNHLPIREGVGKIEIWPQIKEEKLKEKKTSFDWELNFSIQEKYDAKDQLAEIIASKIRARIKSEEILTNKNRPIKYGDFMILLRKKTDGFYQSLVKYFHQYHIPFLSSGKINFSDSLLIQDLLAVAKFSLLKEDDLNLACLLKSPIFNLSEEELFEISLLKNQHKISLYEALKQIDKFTNTQKYLEEILSRREKLSAFEFFYFLIEEKNNRQKIINYFGIEALQILDKFLISLNDYSINFSNNLQKFLEFVEEIDPEILLSSNDDAVKINTVHSAKGLQSPIVIMPDCCYNFSQLLSTKEKIIWLDELPIYLAKKAQETQIIKSYRQKKLQEIKDEYLRLFYVAMTRAEDELYIGGYGNSKDQDSWYEIAARSLPDAIVKSLEVEIINYDALAPENKLKQTKKDDLFFQFSSQKIPENNQIFNATIRGKLIHKILEIIGQNYQRPKEFLSILVQKLIEKEDFFPAEEKKLIHQEIANFIASELFDKIFSGEIKCETEIALAGKLIRIDLLKITDDEVWVIDYKSDETLKNEIPTEYLEQLNLYQSAVKNIYPGKKICCGIFWVKSCKLEFV